MHNHTDCKYMHLKQDFTVGDLAAFHGHLGPFIIIGYRIGTYVRDTFCDNPFDLAARIYCSGKPPQSCLADGVQLGRGCTLGKRNIEIIESSELAVEFERGGEILRIVPHPFTIPDGAIGDDSDYEARVEALAEEMYSFSDSDLFAVSRK